MVEQVLQMIGALLVLAGYLLLTSGKIHGRSVAYQSLAGAGSLILLATALMGRQWGFVLLNLVWVVVAVGMVLRPPAPQADGPTSG